MIKKITAISLAILCIVSLSSCIDFQRLVEQPQEVPVELKHEGTENEKPTETIPEDIPKTGYTKEQGVKFELPLDQVERYRLFILPFNYCAVEFSSLEKLNDYTLVYTAAAALHAEFELSIDGTYSILELTKLEAKIKEYFGAEACLSESFASKEYFPYQVDTANSQLIQYSTGGIASFFFPWAIIEMDEGYELYLIDLMDPLFFDDPNNQEKLFNDDEILLKDIEAFALQMQFNIYHIVEQPNGRLMLKGFRYENKKDIIGFVF